MAWIRPNVLIAIGLVSALATGMAQAELTVIYDSGDSRPIAPYLDVFKATDVPPAQAPEKRPSPLGAADLSVLLPIRSLGLTSGKIEPRAHHRPFSRPFFLIGADERSRRWLAEYRERLKEIGAVGMLVQAETVEDVRAIARLADGLPITPASATDIATALGISHFPVLITPQGIEQ